VRTRSRVSVNLLKVTSYLSAWNQWNLRQSTPLGYTDANADLAAQDDLEDERQQPDVLSQTFPPAQAGDEVDIADAFEGCLHAFRDA
jgi:hypothetical protein